MVIDKLTVKEGTKFTVVGTDKIPQLKAIWIWTEDKKCKFMKELNEQRINNIFETMGQVKLSSIGFNIILENSVRPIEERFNGIKVTADDI